MTAPMPPQEELTALIQELDLRLQAQARDLQHVMVENQELRATQAAAAVGGQMPEMMVML